MSKRVVPTFWACDFETTVWGEKLEKERGREQDTTEVWASASVQLYDNTETVIIKQSIRDFLNWAFSLQGRNILYFHNLSFDGSFIVDFLLRNDYLFYYGKDKDQPSRTFQTSISDMGQWYWIKIKHNRNLVEIRNSLKLMPSSLERIGESFKTKHQKLSMNYEGDRHAYCEITEEEREYIRNDVLVLKEALEMMMNEGHDKLTIGSCCMSEFKSFFDKKDYNRLFPDLTLDPLDYDYTGYYNTWDYVHKSYAGGWCFVNPKYAGVKVGKGRVYDVNSLYPSMMHSISGNRYPYGQGQYCKGEPSEELKSDENKYYFIRVRCRFKLKHGCFPWLHIRGDVRYRGNENLYRSDVRYQGQYYRYTYDRDGNVEDTRHEFVFTVTDWELLQDTYDLYDLEIVDHVWFWAMKGIFDPYIDKWAEVKINSKGFMYQLAKLFLNNLYGKLASSDNSSYKEPVLVNDVVSFIYHEEHNKKVSYIPCGSAITSYARNFTIRHAMANYDRFAYADTDSIHLVGEDDAAMVKVDPVKFCHWKNEVDFDYAYYERQKTYAEHVTHENHIPVEQLLDKKGNPRKPYTLLKAAGMGKTAKQAFLDGGYDISELRAGLKIDTGDLKARRIHGGILLKRQPYKLHKVIDKNVKVVV